MSQGGAVKVKHKLGFPAVALLSTTGKCLRMLLVVLQVNQSKR